MGWTEQEANLPPSGWELYEQFLLPLCGWREARSDGDLGMHLVMRVAWNRSVSEKRPLHRVITDDAQFTSINPPGDSYDPNTDDWPREPDPQFGSAMAIAMSIMRGDDEDPSKGATYYWNPRIVKKGCWFDRTICSMDTPEEPYDGWEFVLRHGGHYFYRKAA